MKTCISCTRVTVDRGQDRPAGATDPTTWDRKTEDREGPTSHGARPMAGSGKGRRNISLGEMYTKIREGKEGVEMR